MTREIENLINKYIPKQSRAGVKKLLDKADRTTQRFVSTALSTPIRTIVSEFKPLYDSLTKELPANSISAANNYDMFIADLQNNISNLTRNDEVGERARQDLIMNIVALVPGIETKTAQSILQGAAKYSSNTKQAIKYISSKVLDARQNLIRQSPKAQQLIEKGKSILSGKIDDAFKKAYNNDTISIEDFLNMPADENEIIDFLKFRATDPEVAKVAGKATLDATEEATLRSILRKNSEEIAGLAQQTGVTNAKDLPRLIKFAKQFGDLIKNSPAYIRSQATGNPLTTLGVTGLSIYDVFQEFKNNGDNLLPKSISNTAAVGASLVPGSTLKKLLFAGLGYVAGDKLARAGLKKLGVKDTDSDVEQKEIDAGIRRAGLSQEVPEYLTGQSGKRYHVLNDKIFDYSTGKPVNIQAALADVRAGLDVERQSKVDRLNDINMQIGNLQNQSNMGYNITPDMLEPLVMEQQQLQQDISNIDNSYGITNPEYDASGDLISQVATREVLPVQQAQQAVQQNAQDVYKVVFDKIAQDTFSDMDKFYTPENQRVDYYTYMQQYAKGGVPFMTPDEFSRYAKVQAMHKLAPQLQQKAMEMATQLGKQQFEQNMEIRKQNEVERAGYANDLINAFKAQETARHNRVGELTENYKAQSGRMSSLADIQNAKTRIGELGVSKQRADIAQQQANIAGYNAQTSRERANIEREYLPFKQGQAASQTVMNVGMSGMPLDTFLNSNQSLFAQIYPGTQQGNQDTTQQDIQAINEYYNK